MKTEHTPGPYHADHSGGRVAIWALGDKRVFLGACSEKEIGRREAEANAALFVASPDLLAVCEALVQWHDHCDLYTVEGLIERLAQARAAIAKARG